MAIDVVLMVPVKIRMQIEDREQAIGAAKRRITEWLGEAGCIPPGYKIGVLETKVTQK